MHELKAGPTITPELSRPNFQSSFFQTQSLGAWWDEPQSRISERHLNSVRDFIATSGREMYSVVVPSYINILQPIVLIGSLTSVLALIRQAPRNGDPPSPIQLYLDVP